MQAIKNNNVSVEEQQYKAAVEALLADFEQERDTMSTLMYVRYLLHSQETASADMKIIIATELYAVLGDNFAEVMVMPWDSKFLGLAFNKAMEFLNVIEEKRTTSKHASQDKDLYAAKMVLNMFLTMVINMAGQN